MDEAGIRSAVADSLALKQRFFTESEGLLLQVGRRIGSVLSAGGRILTFGNGGSAADAQHFAGELVGRFQRQRQGLSALALTTNPSVITAVGNDLGFDTVFKRQVEAHGRAGDVAFGITTSGRSQNVIEAFREARRLGLVTVALTGEGGARLVGLVDHLIAVPSQDTQRIQETHGMVVHILCAVIEDVVAP